MKKSTVGILAALAAVSVASTANAQTSPFSLGVNAGAAIPTGDFADLVTTGWTVGVDGTFNITPMFGVYAGYSLSQFSLSDDAQDLLGEGDVTEQGFDAGIKATFGGGALPFTPFLKGGLIFHKIGADFEDEEDEEDSDSELGFEVGGGVVFPLGPRISVVPSASYLQWTPEEDGDETIDISQVKVQIGLNIRI